MACFHETRALSESAIVREYRLSVELEKTALNTASFGWRPQEIKLSRWFQTLDARCAVARALWQQSGGESASQRRGRAAGRVRLKV